MDLSTFIFIWLAIMALVSMFMSVEKWMPVEGEWVLRWKIIWATASFFPIFFLACMGQMRGDTSGYVYNYLKVPGTWSEIRSLVLHFKSGNGYTILINLIKMVFGNNSTAFRIVLALIHSIPIILVYRCYSTDYLLSVYLFAASGCHFAWMMNGIRQYVAVVMIFAATPWIIRKKYLRVILVILLAATVHTSALMMLPVIFIVQGEPWNKRTIAFIILAVIATLIFSQRVDLADIFLEGTEYEGAITFYQRQGDDGVNPFRVIISAIPPAMALWGRRKHDLDTDPVINICVNMSIISFGLFLVAMVTSGIMAGRMPIYVQLYSFILLPYLCKRMFTGRSSLVVTGLMIIFYYVFYLYS